MLNTSHIAKDFSRILQPVGTQKDDFVAFCKKNVQRISTGFLSIDIALNGGFSDELYIMGSETSTGKSALMMGFAQNIAEQGTNVLYFSLEMSTREFVARAISNMSFIANREDPIKKKYTAGDILYWTYDKQLKKFTKIPYTSYADYADQYFDTYGDHLYIIEGGVDGLSAKDVADIATTFNDLHPEQQMMVIVDYMQFLKADPADHAQVDRKTKTDVTVATLKVLASQVGMPVFTASSVSRTSYGDKVSTSSFKESGDTEYTGGVLIGWNWVGVTDTADKIAAENEKTECAKRDYRIMEFEVIKFRNSQRNHGTKLAYYPAYNHFTDVHNLCEENPFVEFDKKPKPIRF